MSLFDKRRLAFPADTLPRRNTPMPVTTLYAINGHSATNASDGVGITIFVMGCFQGVERLFWQLPDVYNTVTGYIGDYVLNLTYREVYSGDTGHAEAAHIVYDPPIVSYEQLLQVFWEGHNPAQGVRQDNDHGTRYYSAIYPLIPKRDIITRASLERFQATVLAANDDHRITIGITSATPFYYTKDDHQ